MTNVVSSPAFKATADLSTSDTTQRIRYTRHPFLTSASQPSHPFVIPSTAAATAALHAARAAISYLDVAPGDSVSPRFSEIARQASTQLPPPPSIAVFPNKFDDGMQQRAVTRALTSAVRL